MSQTIAAITGLARMVPVIRAQQESDLRSVFLPPEMHPLCSWAECHHRAGRDHGIGSDPRFECEPHAQFGAAYEEVRVRTGAVAGAAETIAGLAAAALGRSEDLRSRGRALLVEGVRSFVANTTKRKG